MRSYILSNTHTDTVISRIALTSRFFSFQWIVKVDKKPNNARELYAHYHQLNVELAELPELIRDKQDKILELFSYSYPWACWYDLPWKQVICMLLIVAGLEEIISLAVKSDNPHKAVFEYGDNCPSPEDENDFSTEEQSLIFSLFMNNKFQIASISIFSQSLSDLVSKAQYDDKALFDAVLVDRSVVSCPSIARRIQMAELVQDGDFFDHLSRAVKKSRPRRPDPKHDDLRFMLEGIEEIEEYASYTVEKQFKLLAVDLELFETTELKDSIAAFKKLVQRRNKRKET